MLSIVVITWTYMFAVCYPLLEYLYVLGLLTCFDADLCWITLCWRIYIFLFWLGPSNKLHYRISVVFLVSPNPHIVTEYLTTPG